MYTGEDGSMGRRTLMSLGPSQVNFCWWRLVRWLGHGGGEEEERSRGGWGRTLVSPLVVAFLGGMLGGCVGVGVLCGVVCLRSVQSDLSDKRSRVKKR